MFTVYIIYSDKLDRYYVGYTNDIIRRLSEHNRKKGKYTDTGKPWIIVYTEKFNSVKQAKARERFIKSRKSKQFLVDLIINGR